MRHYTHASYFLILYSAENHMLQLTSSAPDDGRMCPKHVELRKYQ